jgi:hypothetical protein
LIHFVDVPVVDNTCPSVPVALNESRIFNTAKLVAVAFVIVALVAVKFNTFKILAHKVASTFKFEIEDVEIVVVPKVVDPEVKLVVEIFVEVLLVIVALDKLAVPELTVRLDIVVVAAEVVARLVIPVATRLVVVALVIVALRDVRLVKIAVTALNSVANKFVDVALVIVALAIFAPTIVPLGRANEPEA